MLGGVCIGAIVEYHFYNTYFLSSLFVRRLFYVPALLNYQYYDFFSMHEIDCFRQSFLRHLGIVSPYSDSLPRVIGAEFYTDAYNANNGLFSDAILNLGIIGIFIFPIILVILLKFIDSLSEGIENKFLMMPVLMISISIFAGSLMSSLLTNGILFVMLLFYIFPRTSLYNNFR